ncbi:SRPBCC family protein [Algibacter sp.]|uniref:SRPBCC family protein n=1 Tax=Algibacter sp. TaxID=1872428 RepID=UPI003C73749E
MPLIEVQTEITADLKTCFDLARDIDFYQKSLKNSAEIAVFGKITGLVELNDSITWEAKHLGFVNHLTLKVTEFDSPNLFVDEMIQGNFKAYKHEHIFIERNKTIMIDRFYFESPYGFIGKFIDWLFMKKYMTNFLKRRNEALKIMAEKIQNNHGVIKQ